SADCHSSPIYQLIRGAHYPSFGKPHDGLGFAPVMCQHTHGSTGICGIVYIDGGVWGPEWDDHMFVGNCVTSKVNHDKVTFTGSTPKANEQPDFITSDDPWFRPVDLQLGPDNALYIADFYNKIIGHYEVPLDHPGRDKERGRIWRVVKKTLPSTNMINLAALSPEGLVKEFDSPNLARRWFATQLLPTRFKPGEGKKLNDLLINECLTDLAKAQALWVGEIHDRTSTDPAHFTIEPTGEIGLVHWALVWAAKGAGEGKFPIMWLSNAWGLKGEPPSAHVRKAIVSAFHTFSGRNAYEGALMLGSMHETVPANDESLRHSVITAMRSLLLDEQTLEEALKMFEGIPPEDLLSFPDMLAFIELWEKVSLSLPHGASSAWLMRYTSALPQDNASMTARLSHTARYGDASLLTKAIALAKKSSLQDSKTALLLLSAINDGLSERGAPANPELLVWAQELALKLLASLDQKAAPAWTSLAPAESAPKWSLQSRQCSDGREAKVLQSMIKGGDEEKLTGILRSKDFSAPAKLTLWINGHRGFPASKAHDKNLVRIVDAKDSAVLASAFPPRNDVCQRVELDLAKHVGKAVRLEIVDGDDGKAYAWLGITRIEPAVISVDDFQAEDSTRASLKTLAAMLQHTAPAALREKLAAFMAPRPAPPPLPISPEQRKQLDALITARSSAFAKARPDAGKGKQLFLANCAVCHRIGGEGGLVGPQLDDIGNRGADRLCEDILDPNRNVDAHFHIHTLTLKDGSTMSGFLKGEAGQVIILADAAGQEHRVGKTEVVKDDPTPMSLMPPVFGQTIPEKDFTDLLGWLLTK
ncbi:MAG: c-type cytochrome, partial [Prosthecobacter sp.]